MRKLSALGFNLLCQVDYFLSFCCIVESPFCTYFERRLDLLFLSAIRTVVLKAFVCNVLLDSWVVVVDLTFCVNPSTADFIVASNPFFAVVKLSFS